MPRVDGMTTTDAAETIRLKAEVEKAYPNARLPACVFCRKMTGYVVEDMSWGPQVPMYEIGKSFTRLSPLAAKSPAVLTLFLARNFAGYVVGQQLLIPITLCFRCGAKSDGERAGKFGLPDPRPESISLSEDEKREFFDIFYIAKARATTLVSETRTKEAGRYGRGE